MSKGFKGIPTKTAAPPSVAPESFAAAEAQPLPALEPEKLQAVLEATPPGEEPAPAQRPAPSLGDRARQQKDSPRRRADRSADDLERMTVHLPRDLIEDVRVYAARNRCSLSFATEQALRALVGNQSGAGTLPR